MVSTRQMAITTGPSGNDDGFQPTTGRSPHHHPQPGTSSSSGGGGSNVGSNAVVPMVIGSSTALLPGNPNVVAPGQQIFIEDLPLEIMYKIFSYVEFKKVAQVRMVSVATCFSI